jgi:hypothetical protein
MMGKTIKIHMDRNTFRVWEKFGNYIAEKEKWKK